MPRKQYGRAMKHLLRTAVLIVAAMVGCALVLVGLYFLIGNLTILGNTPAHFLPSMQTESILHSPNAHQLEIWSEVFTELEDLEDQNDAIAILNLHEDTRVAVSFNAVENLSEGTLGNFAVRASDARVVPMLGVQGETVHATKEYKMISKSFGDEPWVYIQSAVVEEHQTLVSRVLENLLYGSASYRGIAKSDMQTLTVVPLNQKNVTALSVVKDVADIPNQILLLSSASMANSWKQLTELLTLKDSLLAESFVRKLVAKIGEDISMEYDVLPLLQEPSTLHLSQTGSLTSFLLEGSLSNTKEREQIFDRLHETIRNKLPTVRVTKRVLDKRFSTTDLRHDPDLIELEQYTLHGWAIRITRHKEETLHLATANKGSRFIVSDNKDLIETAITHRTALQTASLSKENTVRSAGYVDLPAFTELLEWWLPLVERWSSLLEHEGTLFWSIEEDANVRFVHTKIPSSK